MITYDELNTQNAKITELSHVLSVLIKDRSLCDSKVCCKLFYNFMEKIETHMKLVDSNFYHSLLGSSSPNAKTTASNFMAGSHEIKKVMKAYARKWCNKSSHEIRIGKGQHDRFIAQTDDMFEMILDRIQDEMEKLYPMVRKISNG